MSTMNHNNCNDPATRFNPTKEELVEEYDSELSVISERLVRAAKDPYVSLGSVLMEALNQAAQGKGRSRHGGQGVPFPKQPMMNIMRSVGVGFGLGQAMKKAIESQRLDSPEARAELLGAINYLAGVVLILKEQELDS